MTTDDKNKKTIRLVLFDVTNIGTDWMDVLFDTRYVELCEVFVLNENTSSYDVRNIAEIAGLDGWDYVVIPYINEIYDTVCNLLNKLQVPRGKMIFINEDVILCEDYDRIRYIFSDLMILRNEVRPDLTDRRTKELPDKSDCFWYFLGVDQQSLRILYAGFGKVENTGCYFFDMSPKISKAQKYSEMLEKIKNDLPQGKTPFFVVYARIYEAYREILLLLLSEYPEGYVVPYYGDMVEKHFFNIRDLYLDGAELVFSFDEKDAKEHGIFYLQEPLSGLEDTKMDSVPLKYDVLFVGVAKDRLGKIIQAYEKLTDSGLVCEFYIMSVDEKDMIYPDKIKYNQWLDYSRIIELDRSSRCLLEIMQNDDSYSPTTRFTEARLLGKKILTNCPALKDSEDKNIIYFDKIENIDIDRVKLPYQADDTDYSYFYSIEALVESVYKSYTSKHQFVSTDISQSEIN